MRGRIVLAALAVLVLLAIFAVGGFSALVLYRSAKNWTYNRYPRYLLSELYAALKTGDLVFFDANEQLIVNAATMTSYSHGGVVIADRHKVWIAETQPSISIMPDGAGGQVYLPQGSVLTPFLARIKYYSGVTCVMRLQKPLSPAAEKALRRAAGAAVAYPSRLKCVAELVFGGLARDARRPTRHCFQHMGHLLDAAGISPVEGPFADKGVLSIAASVCRAHKIELTGNGYDPPCQVLYDIDTIKV